MLTYVGDGVVLVDRAGVIRLWNPMAEAITGLSAESVLGRAAFEPIQAGTSSPSGSRSPPSASRRGRRRSVRDRPR